MPESESSGVHSEIAASTFRGLATEARGTVGFLPALKKPGITWFWLRSARRAHAAMATGAVFLVLLLPPALHFAFSTQFPPKPVTAPSGAVTRFVDDTRVWPREVAALGFGWAVGAGVAALLLWMHIPVAVVRAAVESRRREREADERCATEPRVSQHLYEEALAIASDPEHEHALRQKILWTTRRLANVSADETVAIR